MDQISPKNINIGNKSNNINIWFTVVIIVCILVLFGLVFYAIFKPSLVKVSEPNPTFDSISVLGYGYFNQGVTIGGVDPFVKSTKGNLSKRANQMKSLLVNDPLQLFSVNLDTEFTKDVNITGDLTSNNVYIQQGAGPVGTVYDTVYNPLPTIIGDTGPQGSTGPRGYTGPQGNDGSASNTGATGPQGNTGPQGIQGVTGPQGIKGDTGSYPTNAQLSTLGVTGTANFYGSVQSLSSTENEFSAIQIFNPSDTTFPRGRIAASSTNLFLQGPQYNGGSIIISKYADGNEIALFDTSTGTNGGSTQLQLIRSIIPDYTKANNTYYRYTLNSNQNILQDGYLYDWNGATGTNNNNLVSAGLFVRGGWQCPKSGMYLVTGLVHYVSSGAGVPILAKYTGNFGTPVTNYSMQYTLIGVNEYNGVLQQYIPIFAGDVCAIQASLGAISQDMDTTYLQFQLMQEFV